MSCVYAIRECRNGPIRYVGETGQPVNVRFSSHRSKARRGYQTAVFRWLATAPGAVVEVLEQLPHDADRKAAEARWIRKLIDEGCELINSGVDRHDWRAKLTADEETKVAQLEKDLHAAKLAVSNVAAKLAPIRNRAVQRCIQGTKGRQK